MYELSPVSCNACSQSIAPFLGCTVDHWLIETVPLKGPLLLDALAQLFCVLDTVPVNAVLQNPDTAKSTGFRPGLLRGHSDGGMKFVRALMHACLIIN